MMLTQKRKFPHEENSFLVKKPCARQESDFVGRFLHEIEKRDTHVIQMSMEIEKKDAIIFQMATEIKKMEMKMAQSTCKVCQGSINRAMDPCSYIT